MKEQDFCYWLQGFVELQDSDSISEKQWLVIKDHLKLVFDKKTPDLTTEHSDVDSYEFFRRPKPVDLIGKQFDSVFWKNNPPATC